jgi:hypothetical protein
VLAIVPANADGIFRGVGSVPLELGTYIVSAKPVERVG